MCDVYDVIEASCSSADVIVSTVYDFGGNNLGEGVRRLAGEMLNFGIQSGYEQGAVDIAPLAYSKGIFDGWHQGYATGNLNGFIKGSLITAGSISVFGLAVWGIKNLVKKQNAKKAKNLKAKDLETVEVKSYE